MYQYDRDKRLRTLVPEWEVGSENTSLTIRWVIPKTWVLSPIFPLKGESSAQIYVRSLQSCSMFSYINKPKNCARCGEAYYPARDRIAKCPKCIKNRPRWTDKQKAGRLSQTDTQNHPKKFRVAQLTKTLRKPHLITRSLGFSIWFTYSAFGSPATSSATSVGSSAVGSVTASSTGTIVSSSIMFQLRII